MKDPYWPICSSSIPNFAMVLWMTEHWQRYVLIKYIIGGSIWRLHETLEAISLAFTCQWFIILNKEDLIAAENCSLLIELAE